MDNAAKIRNIRSELSGYKGGLCKRNDCKYKGPAIGGTKSCDYMSTTKKMRGCPADQCDKYEKVKRKPAKRRVKNW